LADATRGARSGHGISLVHRPSSWTSPVRGISDGPGDEFAVLA
jgi:hypothetical protein